MRVAVIGTGISGLSAAWLLSRHHHVEVFEREPRPGGHSHTVTVEGPSGPLGLDTGFLVFNREAYPLFVRLLQHLGVATQESALSFSVSCQRCELEYASNGLGGVLAQPRNLFRPAFLGMLREILRFNREAPGILDDREAASENLESFLSRRRFGHEFRQHYLVPMAAAIWSSGAGVMKSFPAQMLVRFFKNHGLLDVKQPFHWRTVTGGSRTYVERIVEPFASQLHTSRPVRSVRRSEWCATLTFENGESRDFDRVVIATHADEAFRLLEDPSKAEWEALSPWRYSDNHAVLHTDSSFLPKARRARAAWNYHVLDCRTPFEKAAITYSLNALQAVEGETNYLVTLNPHRPVAEEKVVRRIDFTHPVFTPESIATQRRIQDLNGIRNTFFAGAYLRYGFHEDGLMSGVAVAEALGSPFD